MNWPKYTAIFIGVMIAAIGVYDVFAIVGGGTSASISHMIIVWSYKYPAFTFLFGFVMGHLFWRVRGTKELNAIEAMTKAGAKDADISKD